MILLAFLVVLTEGLVHIPPAHWKAVPVKAPEQGTTIDCAFTVREGGSRVQVLLLERGQAERFRRGRPVEALYFSGFETSGRFRHRVYEAGDYVLVLDNRIEARKPAVVSLRLELINPRDLGVRTLPPERRRAVVALSLLFFGTVLVFSARQYLKHA